MGILRSVTLPADGFEWLLRGREATGLQVVLVRTGMATLPIRAPKPGDAIPLPGGRKLIVRPEEVTRTRAVLLPKDYPILTRLQQVEGAWEVAARPFSAARKAADAARAKAEGRQPPGNRKASRGGPVRLRPSAGASGVGGSWSRR